MATDMHDIQTVPEPSMTALVNGIITDTQKLFEQQIALLRLEISNDFTKAKQAGSSLMLGIGFVTSGCMLLAAATALFLDWIASLPLWAGFAIMGAVLALIGSLFCWAAIKRLETINPVPEQSVEAVKEDVKWATNRK